MDEDGTPNAEDRYNVDPSQVRSTSRVEPRTVSRRCGGMDSRS
jgi:hypothetical protein